jgi:hypothetical protein
MVVGFKRALQMEDLPPMLPSDTSVQIAARFRKAWWKQYVWVRASVTCPGVCS